MLTRPAPSRPRPHTQCQGHGIKAKAMVKAKTERIKLIMLTQHSSVCNFLPSLNDLVYTKTGYLKHHCWLLPVLRLTEVTVTGNTLHLAGKILVLVKLMALTIYAKVGLLRPRTNIIGNNRNDAMLTSCCM